MTRTFQTFGAALFCRQYLFVPYLTIEAEDLPELIFGRSTGTVYLVAQDEDRAVGKLLVRQERVKLNLGLLEPGTIARINQKYDGIHSGKVITPYLEQRMVI